MRSRALWLIILLTGIAPAASALFSDNFSTDKSIKYLSIILGGNVGFLNLGASANPMLSYMFQGLNSIVMVVGTLVISYIGIVSTVNTAKEGEVMGKKWASPWIPARTILGMLLMTPVPGSGYSSIQMIITWIVLQGVGAANTVWDIVIDQSKQGISAMNDVRLSTTEKYQLELQADKLSPAVMNMATCAASLEYMKKQNPNHTDPFIRGYGHRIRSWWTEGKPSVDANGNATIEGRFYVGIKEKNIPICGSVTIKATAAEADKLESQTISLSGRAREAYYAKLLGITHMYASLYPAAQEIVKNDNDIWEQHYADVAIPHHFSKAPKIFGYRRRAEANYFARLVMLYQPLAHQNQAKNYLLQDAHENGWVHAASYYAMLNTTEEQKLMQTVLQDVPNPTTDVPTFDGGIYSLGVIPSFIHEGGVINNIKKNLERAFVFMQQDRLDPGRSLGNLADEYEEDAELNGPHGVRRHLTDAEQEQLDTRKREARKAYQNRTHGRQNMHKSVRDYQDRIRPSAHDTLAGKTNDVLKDMNEIILQEFKLSYNKVSDGLSAEDPLMAISKFGATLMKMSELTWGATFTGASSGAIISMIKKLKSNDNVDTSVVQTLDLGISAMLSAGSALIMIWTTAASIAIYLPMIPYFMFTVASIGWMIQVLELIVTAPIFALGFVAPSGEELGKTTPGFMMLANVFLRPTLMVFGFILGARVLSAVVALINFGFKHTLESTAPGINSSIFGPIMLMLIYGGMVIASTNKCYKLTHTVADGALRVLGGSQEGSDVEQVVNRTEQKLDQGSTAVQGVFEGGSITAMKKVSTQWKNVSEPLLSGNEDQQAAKG